MESRGKLFSCVTHEICERKSVVFSVEMPGHLIWKY